MINPMDWLEILLVLGGFIAAITAVIIGNKLQIQAHKEATAQEVKSLVRQMQLLQMEAKECRERIDNVLGLLAKNARQTEKD